MEPFRLDATGPGIRAARISECGLYRYTLDRAWSRGRKVNWVMLNPSKADASRDDPTLKRIIRFSRDWGFGSLVVTNLFALRSTDPEALRAAPDPVGPENDDTIMRTAEAADVVCCAWGAHPMTILRGPHVAGRFRAAGILPRCLGLTANGSPLHPLRLPTSLVLVPFGG